jgi:SHAQKYF class myb-like DNA-binding protein
VAVARKNNMWATSVIGSILFVFAQDVTDVEDVDDEGDEGDEDEYEEEAIGEIKTGRWTPAEHAAFLRGMALHGREWKKVARTIQSRSSAQIRSHAQKHFAKSTRPDAADGGGPSRASPAPRERLGQALTETLAALVERRRELLHQGTERGDCHSPESSGRYSRLRAHDRRTGGGSEVPPTPSDQELEAIHALNYLRGARQSSGALNSLASLSTAAEARPLGNSSSTSSLSSLSSSRPASPSLVTSHQKRQNCGCLLGGRKRQHHGACS